MLLCSNIFHILVQVLNWKVFLLSEINVSALQFNWFCILPGINAHNPASVPIILCDFPLSPQLFKYLPLF